MNAKKRERILFAEFLLQKLGEFLDDPMEKSKQLRMAYNGLRAYLKTEVEKMTQDELLNLKTNMERKQIQIDYKKHLDFAYRNSQLIVDADELRTLAGYATTFACQFCDRDREEQNNCILRETLIRCNAVIGIDLARKDICPYRGQYVGEIVASADQRLQNTWERAHRGGNKRWVNG